MINEKIIKNDERAIFELRELYRQYGYSRFKMSRFEEYDLYVKNKDFLVSDEVITFTDKNGKLMALKPDVTLSIIKNTVDTPGFTRKVYYNENVYRVSKGNHSFKEIMQAGLECIGDLHSYEIAEVVLLAVKSLALLSENYVLDISHRGLVTAMLDDSGLSYEGKGAAYTFLHQKNSHELRAVCESENIPEDKTAKLCALVDCCGSAHDVLPAIAPLLTSDKEKETFAQLNTLCDIIERSGFSDSVIVDFSVGNDMKYYSGVVLKGYIEGVPTSILSGGQYDKLLKKMNRTSGAIGFAIYLDLLEQFDNFSNDYDVDTVLLYENDCDALTLTNTVNELSRDASIRVCTTIPTQLKYRRLLKLSDGRVITLENNG